ncbi:MAG TPA: SPASM domain-containing protein, partial [Armatimonadota bacterium]
TVVNKYNEHELQDIEDLARRYGAGMVSRKTLQPIDHNRFDLDAGYIPDNGKYLNFKHRPNHCPSRNTWRCLRPWNRLTVSSRGVVLPCEFDYNQSEAFGQCDTAGGFLDLWRSSLAENFRNRILTDKSIFPFCSKCPCEWVRNRRHTTTYMAHLSPHAVGRI